MKDFIISHIVGVYTFVLWYLLASCYSNTFCISQWSKETKVVVCVLGGIGSLIAMIIAIRYINNNKK